MTEKKVRAIDDHKSEMVNSIMRPRKNAKFFAEDHSVANQETSARPSEDGPNDEFVDERARNDYDSSEEFNTFNNVQLIDAKKKTEVAAEQPEIRPILLENQATSNIESKVEYAEEGEDEKKNAGDGLDDKSNLLIKFLPVIQDLYKNFPPYGIDEKDLYHAVHLQISGNSNEEINMIKALGMIKDIIREKDADIDHSQELEDDLSTYIRANIKSANLSHSPGVNGKNVGNAFRDHDDIQKQDVTENEDFSQVSKWDSGLGDLVSQQGSMYQGDVDNEHRKDEKDDKTGINEDPTSEALDPQMDTNPKDQETPTKDSEHVQQKDTTENRDISHVTTGDSGFSDPSFISREDIGSEHPTGEEDNESTEMRVDPESVAKVPDPNLNPDDKMSDVGDQGHTEKKDVMKNKNINHLTTFDSRVSEVPSLHGFISQGVNEGESPTEEKGDDNKEMNDDSTSVILDADPPLNPKKQMSSKRDQGHIQTKEVTSTKHFIPQKIPISDASSLRSLQNIKSQKGNEIKHSRVEADDDLEDARDNRKPVILEPDPNLSPQRGKRAIADQGRVQGKPPSENEDTSHVSSCDSDVSHLRSVTDPTSQDFDTERPEEGRKVNVSDKNDGGRWVHSKLDSELSCNIRGRNLAGGDQIPEKPNKKKAPIKTGYLGVEVNPFLFIIIAFFFTPSVMSVLANMNPAWYKEGDNATIDIPLQSYRTESTGMAVNVRMHSMPKPFYSNGIKHDGFKNKNQVRRFNVLVDGEGMKINITDFRREDEDVYIITQTFYQDDGSTNGVSWNIELKCLIPAQCQVLNGSSHITVHCNAAVASPATALFCFQGISFCSPYLQRGIPDGEAEFRMKNSGEPIRCCSKAQVDPSVSISANPENCHDFTWPPAKPTSTHEYGTVPPVTVNPKRDGGTTSDETVPLTPSSGSRLGYVHSLMIGLVLSWFFVWEASITDRVARALVSVLATHTSRPSYKVYSH